MTDQVAEQGTVEPTPEQVAQEESQALSAGYAKARGETPAEAKEPAKAESQEPGSETKVEAKTETPDPKAEEAAAQAAAEAEWDGVPVKVRQMLEGISSKVGTIDKLQHDFKSIAGRTGAALEGVHALKTAMEAAKAVTKEAGAEAPTQAQITAAAGSGEKWKAIKVDFPEWAEAMEERLAAIPAARSQADVDVEKLRKEWQQSTQAQVAGAINVAEERAYVRLKHPDWKQTVNTDDFKGWMQKQAPEIQALAQSDLADDAIKMLDTYKDHQTAQQAAAEKAAKAAADKAAKDKRLAGNVAPRQAASGGPSILPDEAGLSVGYNRVRRA